MTLRTLKVLNSQQMTGGSPAHLALSLKDDFDSVANYAGSLSLFPLNFDGSVAAQSFIKTSPLVVRLSWTPKLQATFTVPCGCPGNELLVYELDATKKTLTNTATVKCPPGSGSRHLAMHPKRDYFVVVVALLYRKFRLAPGFTNTSTAADIHFSSNEKFVYVSNRDDNSIVAYKVNADGTLEALSWTSLRGVTPRSFIIYENLLIVANQGSNDMYVSEVDGETGALKYTGNSDAIDEGVSLYVAEY
ncbi:unnamed protein product [Peronospora destructor]|nr:unnamed protein product [Peronospora destructor]